MSSPTADDVHIPSAIGNKTKGKQKMAAKKMDDGDDGMMGKGKMGAIPPQFLPKQKEKMSSARGGGRGAPAARGGGKGAKGSKAGGKSGAKR
jgi:hypothetical protein